MLSNKTWCAILLFAVSVLVLTRIDFLVHSTLYDYGLIFSYSWAVEYWYLYAILYQLVIVPLSLWTRNLYFFFAAQAFVLSATQDLFFFGLWCGSFPPETVNWWWMPTYRIFGFWSTSTQFVFSILVNVLVFAIAFIHFTFIIEKRNRYL